MKTSQAIMIVAGLLLSISSQAAKPPVGKSRTIDLGQLEIQGELRRPPVNWVGNYKGMREILPVLYSEEFSQLEKEILDSPGGNASLRGVTLSKPDETTAPKRGKKK